MPADADLSGARTTAAPPDAPTPRELLRILGGLDFRRRRVRFLLGTDEFIAKERRVAFTPKQVATLRHDLESLDLEPEIAVVRGAGERAGEGRDGSFGDEAYGDAGAELLSLHGCTTAEPFDVVHSLKEPTAYESRLPGPFLRIGALHLATYPAGVCALLGAKNFAAILDGAVVGGCSYRLQGGDRTPIVASMSRFAGAVSGRKVVEGVEESGIGPGKVVVVGGGVAGQSAIREMRPQAARLVVIEPWEPMRRQLEVELPELGFPAGTFEIRAELEDDALDDAIGIVFAHRTGARAAEKVCDDEQIRRMKRGAVIADIAIDQGGSIRHPGFDEEDDAAEARRKYLELFADDFVYYGEVNMPREEPYEASIHHGRASLPYVTLLLALCAHLGGPEAVVRHLLERERRVYGPADEIPETSLLEAMIQDLRNGVPLALVNGRVEVVDGEIEEDATLREWVRRCAE